MAMYNYYCDEVKKIIQEVSPNYPQLTTYEKEWVYFHKYGYIPGIPVDLEYATVETTGHATVPNTIPFSYKSAILKGNTKYRDIDTGDILDTFDETKNLELVSVKLPVLTTSNEDDTKTNILTVNEPVELRGIGDVKDELNLLTGELTQHIGEVIYDGSDDENWAIIEMPNTPDNIGFYLPVENYLSSTDNNRMKSSVIDNLGFTKNCISGTINENILNGKNGFSIHENGNAYFTTPLLECRGLTEWKAKLKQRPLILRYALKQKPVKTVDLSVVDQNGNNTQLKPFDGTTHITISSDGIKPIAILEVPVVSTGNMTLQEIQNQE